MDFDTLSQAITTFGFPIVCCGVLAYILYKTIVSHNEEMEKISGVITELKETVINNTNAINNMNEKFTSIITTILDKFSDKE